MTTPKRRPRANGHLDDLFALVAEMKADEPTYLNVDVTKRLALQLVEANAPNNRKKKAGPVSQYKRDMMHRKWPITGDSIKLTTDPLMIDGNQRMLSLLAAMEEDPTLTHVRMAFAFNVSKEAMKVTDTGSKRTFADALRIEEVPNVTPCGAIVRRVFVWERGNYADIRGGGPGLTEFARPTMTELMDRYLEDRSQFDAATHVANDMRDALNVFHQAAGTAYYILRQIDDQMAKAFFEGLVTGADLPMASPVRILRRRLERAGRRADKADMLTATEQLWLYMRAWNVLRTDEVLTRFQFPYKGITNLNFVRPV